MATGSWKTLTIANFLNELYEFRKRYIWMYWLDEKDIPAFKVLMLSHLKWLTDQHKRVFFDGEYEDNEIKKPLLSSEIIHDSYVKVYHSSADGNWEETWEDITVENFWTQKNKNQFVFAVDKTAIKWLDWFKPNIVIADEAHHITENQFWIYRMVVEKFNKRDHKINIAPLLLALTATPWKWLIDLVWKPWYEYLLAAFLASEWSPSIKYIPVSFKDIPEDVLKKRDQEVLKISHIKDIEQKKEKVKSLKEEINKKVKKFENPTYAIKDFYDSMKWDTSQTLIYAKNIKEAEDINTYINENNLGNSTVMHSEQKKSSTEILEDYQKWKVDIIVAVWQMDEGIDSKRTFKNIVLMEDIWSPTKFKQRIGRWMRWNWILTIWDYGCTSMANLWYITTINEEIEKITKEEQYKIEKNKTQSTPQAKKLNFFQSKK